MCSISDVQRLIVVYIKTFTGCTVENAIVSDAPEKEDTETKQDDVGERLEVTPGEQPRTKTPSPVHILTIVAEAGGSARHLLASIRSRNKRGTPCSVT